MAAPGTPFVHRIDADDVITFVDEGWAAFAAENAGPAPDDVVGRCLWDSVSGSAVHELYEEVLTRVRGRARPVRFPYRCDSPGLRRYMEMEVRRTGTEVEFASRLLRVEEREPVPLLAPGEGRGDWTIVACSWCRRLRTRDWVEVEQAIRELDLFGDSGAPALSHGVCDDCFRTVAESLGAPTLSR